MNDDQFAELLESTREGGFCGTAVGNVSAQRGAYYAGPGNMFWPTLHGAGLTPRRLQPA